MNLTKKLIFTAVFSLISCFAYSAALSEGKDAGKWSLEDSKGKVFSSESLKGKITLINYLAPEEADLNAHLSTALEEAVAKGIISGSECVSMGIIDCKSSWKPDALIRQFADSKVEKYPRSHIKVLFDYDASIRNAWGFKKNSSNIVILDRNGICRAVIHGKVAHEKIAVLIELVQMLQTENAAYAGIL